MNYLDYIVYVPIPNYFASALIHNQSRGWKNLPITPDSYCLKRVAHCPFEHIKNITIPKIDKIKNNIDGFFIIEGDVKININYNQFLKLNIDEPTWLGYKKKLYDYIVGNFLVYIPIEYYMDFRELVMGQTRKIYSDRFFTKLVDIGFLKLHDTSICEEISHYSNVKAQYRK